MNSADNKETEWEIYLGKLYDSAKRKYPDCPELDSIVADSLLALIEKQHKGEKVEHPMAFLEAVLKNKHNAYLREKYKNNLSYYDCADMPAEEEYEEDHGEEYAQVRREISRMVSIYREVTVRYYMHGQSVSEIAKGLGISEGTVKSRLFAAREQMKEGLEKMEKYSSYSYEPKKITMGIWGNSGLSGEPFSLVSEIEGNILSLAYEAPVSVRGLADTMGIACAYIETIVDRLVEGELLGRTAQGLVYTRCFVTKRADAYGNIEEQKRIADTYSRRLWEACEPYLEKISTTPSFSSYSEKQKGTLWLYLIMRAVSRVSGKCDPSRAYGKIVLPERKNGGRWYAILTVQDARESIDETYRCSGPLCVMYSKDKQHPECEMIDFQSVFGDTHWAYPNMKYKPSNSDILRLYASLLECDVKCEFDYASEILPELERLGIVAREEGGRVSLDIPHLTYDELRAISSTVGEMYDAVYDLLRVPVETLYSTHRARVPAHVDGREYFSSYGAVGCFSVAMMMSVVKQGLLPWRVEIGNTPIILVKYKRREI